jgi:hypothetical protein
VDAAIVEQRAYTEFAYEKLNAKMDVGFARLDGEMDAGFARLDQKIDDIDNRLGKVDGRIPGWKQRSTKSSDLQVPKTPPDVSTSE